VTLHPLATVSITIRISEQGYGLLGSPFTPLINKHPQGEVGEKGRLAVPSMSKAKKRKQKEINFLFAQFDSRTLMYSLEVSVINKSGS
jgi:hypothetical protein